jgi:hypothetical protein
MLLRGVARGRDGPREAAWLGSVMVSVTVVEPAPAAMVAGERLLASM